ncbi:SI1L3 protein, partial [Hirundo rustica]|nr:SI1L3 protein [Hirundo rustica]
MGVRARVANWPPRSRDAAADAARNFHRFPRRSLPRSKDAESRRAFPPLPLRHRSSSEVTLSECDPAESPENPALFFREYGSTSSIDVQGVPERSFFEILDGFRAEKPELAAGAAAENRSRPLPPPPPPPPPKEKPRRRSKPDDSIFRKLPNPRHDASTAAEEPKDPEDPRPENSWILRKSFAHFDVQSIFFRALSAADSAARRRNTATGASAASAACDGAEDSNSKEGLELDLGDDTSNELLLSCPHFRNEIGGAAGAQRDLSFSSSSPARGPASFWTERGARSSNAAVSVLELPKERRKDAERFRAYGVEHVDLGARYYRDYFHGK